MIDTRKLFVTLALGSILSACAAEDLGAPDEEMGTSEAALASNIKLLGSLEFGQTSDLARYSKNPKFRAYKFAADAGDKVVIDVRSPNGGDAIAWLLSDQEAVLASNDDASSGVLDAHIEYTIQAGDVTADIHTFYIVYRDYDLKKKDFAVSLAGGNGFLSCKLDSDCEKVRAGCCGLSYTAVNKDQKDAYKASLSCENIMCPMVMPKETDDVAQCNNATNECELVDPHAIVCGGFRLNMHFCPEGMECVGEALLHDGPGKCVAACGGLAGLPCQDGFVCNDNPMDECDPATGGADCMGICEPSFCGGFGNLACPAELICAENPHDSCDVNAGGADCGGICVNF